MTQQYINFKRERRFGDKINATFAFLSQNLRPIAKSALFVAGPFALLTSLVLQVYQLQAAGDLSQVFSPEGMRNGGMLNSGSWWGYLGITYTVLAFMVALTVALAQRHIRHYIEHGTAVIEPKVMWRSIWGDFLSVFGTSVGLAILMFLGFMLVGIMTGLMVALRSPAVAVLAVVAFFIITLLLSSLLMLIYPIRNFERINFFEAIGRAISLNSGKWWSTAGLVFVTGLIQFVIMLAMAMPMYAVTFFQYFHAENPQEILFQASEFSWFSVFSALTSIIYSVGFTLVGSIMFIAISFQYFSLRERREASGLLERLQTFGLSKPVREEEEEHY